MAANVQILLWGEPVGGMSFIDARNGVYVGFIVNLTNRLL
jgi:hypothetical protein